MYQSSIRTLNRTQNGTLNRTLKERDRLDEKLKQNWQGNIRKDEERQENQRWVTNGRQTKEHPRKASTMQHGTKQKKKMSCSRLSVVALLLPLCPFTVLF